MECLLIRDNAAVHGKSNRSSFKASSVNGLFDRVFVLINNLTKRILFYLILEVFPVQWDNSVDFFRHCHFLSHRLWAVCE